MVLHITKIFLGGPVSGRAYAFQAFHSGQWTNAMTLCNSIYCHSRTVILPGDQQALIFIHMDTLDCVAEFLFRQAEILVEYIQAAGDIAVGWFRYFESVTTFCLSADTRAQLQNCDDRLADVIGRRNLLKKSLSGG